MCMIKASVTVCGNISGQFFDLLKKMKEAESLPETSYLFLGSYVGKGFNSTQTILYLLLLKIKYPEKIILLRGNHDTRTMSKFYGFLDAIRWKYGDQYPWRSICSVFDYLPISAVIENSIFCVHAGLSPSIKVLDQIKGIDRVKQMNCSGVLADFMWSESSDDIEFWSQNEIQGAGYIFGEKIAGKFNHLNGLKLIAHDHKLQMDGYKEWFKKKNVVTIWSAPNHSDRCGNLASFLKVNENCEWKYYQFRQDERRQFKRFRMKDCKIPYFV